VKKVCITDYGADVNIENNAQAIQAAVDACAGGGVAVVPAGAFKSGAIKLHGNTTLYLEKDAVLLNTGNYRDYEKYMSEGWGKTASHWYDSFICADDCGNIAIEGEGTIDGADCYNPNGEEGFRGPHCMRFVRCENVRVSGVRIERSANYPILFICSENLIVSGVAIRGGHDGIHSQRCGNAAISDCDFRTGDDCVAGSDNRNFVIRDCKFNTSCNGFRLGCVNLTAERCSFWGPGEFSHLVSKRRNMLCAIVHFAPPDRDTLLPSGNWQIKDITADNAETLYQVNRKTEAWQKGQPALAVTFENAHVKNMTEPVTVMDCNRFSDLRIKNSTVELKPGIVGKSVIQCDGFDRLELRNVRLKGNTGAPAVDVRNGNMLIINNTENIKTENVEIIKTCGTIFSDQDGR